MTLEPMLTIEIQLTPEAEELRQKFVGMRFEFPQAIKRGLNNALPVVASRIRSKRLTGKGPFPVEEHRLGIRSGFLYSTTEETPATAIIEGENVTVIGAIGTQAFYAKFQEFGTKRLPERAPFRTGIGENMDLIADEIEKELVETLQ